MEPYRIVLADDHVLFRQGLKLILEGKEGLVVVGEAGDGLELLRLFQNVSPQMVILDISMPNLRGIEAMSEIRRMRPDVKILILTMYKDKEYLYQSVSAGANGYLLKQDADTELVSAIQTIQEGKFYLSPVLSEEQREDWLKMSRGELAHPLSDPLTSQERTILKLIAEGKSSKEAAELLFLSVRTVERHRGRILDKLKLKNTAELVRYAIDKGYL